MTSKGSVRPAFACFYGSGQKWVCNSSIFDVIYLKRDVTQLAPGARFVLSTSE